MLKSPAQSTPLTLDQLKSSFAAWRKTKTRRDRIPQELWAAAALLAAKHSVSTISKALGLEYSKLKGLADAYNSQSAALDPLPALPAQDFIRLDLCPPPALSDCTVELESACGNKMKMHFTGQASIDLLDLAKTFWNKEA